MGIYLLRFSLENLRVHRSADIVEAIKRLRSAKPSEKVVLWRDSEGLLAVVRGLDAAVLFHDNSNIGALKVTITDTDESLAGEVSLTIVAKLIERS